jgi:hypothetical protein
MLRLGWLWRRFRERAGELKLRFAAMVFAAAFGLIALAFLAIGLYLYLAQVTAAWQAALLTGLGAAIVAAVIAVAPRFTRNARHRAAKARIRGPEAVRGAMTAVDNALRETGLGATDLVITSLVAGIIMGTGAHRRRAGR